MHICEVNNVAHTSVMKVASSIRERLHGQVHGYNNMEDCAKPQT